MWLAAALGAAGCSDAASEGPVGGANADAGGDNSGAGTNNAPNSAPNNAAPNNTTQNNVNNNQNTCSSRCGEVCCLEDELCFAGACAPRSALCGVELCAEDEVCEEGACRIACETVRCGAAQEVCCGAGEVCLFEACTEPGPPCASSEECALDAYCETSLGVCVPTSANPNACVYIPPVGEFAPVQEWQWSGGGAYPEFNQVMMMPSVANLTDDNGDGVVSSEDVPDVVFTAFSGSRYNSAGVLRALSGDDGRVLFEHEVGARAGNCPALADLDGDGVPEILVERAPDAGGEAVLAVRVSGEVVGESAGVGTGSGGVTVADLDGDGSPEVVARDRVLDAQGGTLCTFDAGASVPVALDLNLDGLQEVFNGTTAYRLGLDGGACPVMWSSPFSGLPAVGNFDDDPEAELVVVGSGQVTVLDHQGAPLWSVEIPIDAPRVAEIYQRTCESTTCNSQDPAYFKGCCPGGGPPTVADVDNDGEVEITVAARWYYLVYETDGSVRWAHKTQDFSSAVTGSSVFDFEGDGRAEVVYNDELNLRIYDGAGSEEDVDGDGYRDAKILFETPNPSGTLAEYPLIVDVDNDGNAEIVVAANNYAFPGETGIRVFGDAQDNWVRTRRIWSQHAYHVTHITEEGQVVAGEPAWWQARSTNAFRLNVQPEGLFNAPNLVVEAMSRDEAGCPARLTLRARVANLGALGVPPGLSVSFWLDAAGTGRLLCETQVEGPLPPGGREEVSCTWEIPEGEVNLTNLTIVAAVDVSGATPGGEHNECAEDDNTRVSAGQRCLPPG